MENQIGYKVVKHWKIIVENLAIFVGYKRSLSVLDYFKVLWKSKFQKNDCIKAYDILFQHINAEYLAGAQHEHHPTFNHIPRKLASTNRMTSVFFFLDKIDLKISTNMQFKFTHFSLNFIPLSALFFNNFYILCLFIPNKSIIEKNKMTKKDDIDITV